MDEVRDLRGLRLDGVAAVLNACRVPIRRYIRRLDKSGSYFDPLATGGLCRKVTFDQGATILVARDSGLASTVTLLPTRAAVRLPPGVGGARTGLLWRQ